jgi:uncharacterized protein (UPF0335 family)
LVYELPELYKALALAYERSRVDESWRIVHSRLNDLVSRAERLLAKGEILGLEFEVYMRGYGIKMLRSVVILKLSKPRLSRRGRAHTQL